MMDGLLEGPAIGAGTESHGEHLARLGPLSLTGPELIHAIDEAGLVGRGGAGFPTATKWRAVATMGTSPVIVVNGAESEPLSHKDRTLMENRPHLVLDGAVAAAMTLGAHRVVLYLCREYRPARASLLAALRERPKAPHAIDVVLAPPRFVAGEETAAVHCVNDNLALPLSKPPRPFERGVGGRPTLVQNVETLARVGLLARLGPKISGGRGREMSSGTVLLTLSGDVQDPGVVEMPAGATLQAAIDAAGGTVEQPSAVLLGGYFGAWVTADDAAEICLDPAELRRRGLSLGCGVVHVVSQNRCIVEETGTILRYLAAESSRQCGPCTFGLTAIAHAATRIAEHKAHEDDLENVIRWARELRGRGACAHPDGAAGLLASAYGAFQSDFISHVTQRTCEFRS
jgi:NADH:ubiquinone oxidoreductase subunit F (NADH-binding)